MVSQAEQAITCFEQLTGLPVVVHDLQHQLWSSLPLTRFRHNQPACQFIKSGPDARRCLDFEIYEFQTQAAQWPMGRVHRCHAGFAELALPVFAHGQLLLVLFAGPAQFADTTLLDRDEVADTVTLKQLRRWRLPVIAADRLHVYQEQLRQLGARLRCLMADAPVKEGHAESLTRRQRIELYIQKHHARPIQLEDLGRELHLSAERCRHVVRQCCQLSFAGMLRQARIRSACALLLNTDLNLAEVAHRCGLPDLSGFNRAFRKATGMSPGQWRRTHRA